MTPVASVAAALHVISAWLLSMLAILAIFVSVVICIAFVEFIFERHTFAQAYSVKMNASGGDGSSTRNTHEM